MLKIPAAYVDPLNIALILVTCVLAHIFPFHLLLFSYAVLGPAHYLTQISWLHDRRYFANSDLLAPVLGIASLILVFLFFFVNDKELLFGAITLSLAVSVALVFTVPNNLLFRGLALVVGISLILLISHFRHAALFTAVLLPTVMHVFVFTAAFMWVGAMKSRKMSAYLSILALIVCAATFIIPAHPELTPSLAGIRFFTPVIDFIEKFFGLSSQSETQLFGFLSFAYTYHYLNWFSKAEIIHWNRIPAKRLNAIIVIYVAAVSIYAVNYTVGILLILLLAHMHVLLELPLNLRTFSAIARGRV